MDKEYTFAVLIDSDNLSIDYYDTIIGEIEKIGIIRYKRVYGNFAGNNSWTKHAIKNGITPIQAFAPVKGKNATDIVMAIDAMDIFYTNTVDAFCLATSDSDFARLAQRLKEGGKYVVVAGKEQSSESLNNSCNKFLMLDILVKNIDVVTKNNKKDNTKVSKTTATNKNTKSVKNSVEQEPKVSAPTLSDIKVFVKEIIDEKAHDGWAYYAEVIPQLEKKYPQFNYKIYGAKGKKDFFTTKIGCEIKKVETSVMIKMK